MLVLFFFPLFYFVNLCNACESVCAVEYNRNLTSIDADNATIP